MVRVYDRLNSSRMAEESDIVFSYIRFHSTPMVKWGTNVVKHGNYWHSLISIPRIVTNLES